MNEEIKSEFQVRIVRIGPTQKHPNADTLTLTEIEGYPVLFKTGSFNEGDLAVYVPVDALVPTDRPEFAFLKKGDKTQHRIKAMKLRGIFSMGLLVPVPLTKKAPEVGDNVQGPLGIEKYIPPEERALETAGARSAAAAHARKAGGLKLPVYGLDAFRKYKDVLQDGEEVVISEKVHGCNARFCFSKGRLWVGSHRTMRGATEHRFVEWLQRMKLKLWDFFGKGHRADLVRDAGDVWWEAARAYDLKERLAKKPGFVLYGEIYGEKVQDLKYDSPRGRKFRAFDVYDLENKRFLDQTQFEEFIGQIGLNVLEHTAPMIYRGPWNEEVLARAKTYADTGRSYLNKDQICEGVVIKPAQERVDHRVGRVALKLVGEGYLLRGEK